jgi:hypothetical protein
LHIRPGQLAREFFVFRGRLWVVDAIFVPNASTLGRRLIFSATIKPLLVVFLVWPACWLVVSDAAVNVDMTCAPRRIDARSVGHCRPNSSTCCQRDADSPVVVYSEIRLYCECRLRECSM